MRHIKNCTNKNNGNTCVPCVCMYPMCKILKQYTYDIYENITRTRTELQQVKASSIIKQMSVEHIENCTNKNNVTRITMATKYPIIKHRASLRILMKLRMDIPANMRNACDKKKEHRSKVKVNTKTRKTSYVSHNFLFGLSKYLSEV